MANDQNSKKTVLKMPTDFALVFSALYSHPLNEMNKKVEILKSFAIT